MDNSYIVTTSGFILPSNYYFIPLTKDEVTSSSIFNRNITITTDNNLAEMLDNKILYYSPIANKAYLDYSNSGSFDNYINLVNIATDILSKVDYFTFFKLQANNKHISMYSLKFCEDLYKENFILNYYQYAIIPFNARLVIDNTSIDTTSIEFYKLDKNRYFNTWEQVLTSLASNRNVFPIFFRYLFVDSY